MSSGRQGRIVPSSQSRRASPFTSLCHRSENPYRFNLQTDHGNWEARNVVLATGPFQRPSIPAYSASLPSEVMQIHSRDYRSPQQLPPAPVRGRLPRQPVEPQPEEIGEAAAHLASDAASFMTGQCLTEVWGEVIGVAISSLADCRSCRPQASYARTKVFC